MVIALSPEEAIMLVADQLTGLPVCIAGSSVAAHIYGLPLSDSADIDVFCYTEEALIAALTTLTNTKGFTLNNRFVRVHQRWLKYGTRGWHTNSIKFETWHGFQVNLVHKLTNKQPMSSLSQVLESFDFGLLGAGYDLSLDTDLRDLRPFLFPGFDLKGPLPLMPNKRDTWANGLVSRYNGIREAGRYAKYHKYGYNLEIVQHQLVDGYVLAAQWLRERGDDDKLLLADIYDSLRIHIEDNRIDELIAANEKILVLDALDQILETLE